MRERFRIPQGQDGLVWYRRDRGDMGGTGHSHDDLEFNVQMRGSASYICEDRRYHMRSHAVVWLMPEREHVLWDVSKDHEMWIVIVKRTAIARMCGEATARFLSGESPEADFCRHIAPETAREMHALFTNLASIENDVHRFNAGLAYGMLTAWAAYQGAEINAEVFDVHPAIGRAMEILRTDDKPPRLAALSHRVGLNQARLSRIFREQLGTSLIDFRNQECLNRFFEIYRQGRSMGMQQAAREAGFGSYQQFYRVFKQQTGRGPQEHARDVRTASDRS